MIGEALKRNSILNELYLDGERGKKEGKENKNDIMKMAQ